MNEIDKLKYSSLVKFLGEVLGYDTEIVLHDIGENSNNIHTIVNGHISNRNVGAPLTDLALKFIINREYEKRNYVCNYSGKSKDNNTIISSTFFIKDENNNLSGLICINQDKNKYLNISKEILKLGKIIHDNEEINLNVHNYTENFSNSISEMVTNILNEFTRENKILPEKMNRNKKLKIIDILNQKGVFMLKGAVHEVAKQLHSSEASIYRYIGEVNKKDS